MMTPKEYANELVDKFKIEIHNQVPALQSEVFKLCILKSAKQCALIAVNEMIEWCEFDVVSDITNQRYIDKLNYLDEVSKEIQLL